MSAGCSDNRDEGCHGDAPRLLCRFVLQNHLGWHLAEAPEEIQRQLRVSSQEPSGGWTADGKCTEPYTDGACGLRSRKRTVESLRDSPACVFVRVSVNGR